MAKITGAHTVIYSKDANADRAFVKKILKLTHVDAGDGWLIFGLPPSEVAVHPSSKNDEHQFYLLTDDINGFVNEMEKQKIKCGKVNDYGWGLLSQVSLPGGGSIGIYQPRHKRPKAMAVRTAAKKPVAKKKVVRRKK